MAEQEMSGQRKKCHKKQNKDFVSLNKKIYMGHLQRNIFGWTFIQKDMRLRERQNGCETPARINSADWSKSTTPNNLNKTGTAANKLPKKYPENTYISHHLSRLPVNLNFYTLLVCILQIAVKYHLVRDEEFMWLQKELCVRYPQYRQLIRQTIGAVVTYLDS